MFHGPAIGCISSLSCVSVFRQNAAWLRPQAADRDAAEENNTLRLLTLENSYLKLHPLITLQSGDQWSPLRPAKLMVVGAWAIFVLGLTVHTRVPHVKPDPVSHPVTVGKHG